MSKKNKEKIKEAVANVVEERKEIEQRSTEQEEHYVLFHVEGGLGKNVLATAVVDVVKKHYPNSIIILVSPWTDAWIGNPNVSRVYKINEAKYFRRDYIFEDTKIFRMDPYFTEDHILHRKGLIENWCNMYGMKYNNEQPKIYLNPRELLQAQNALQQLGQGKPILIVQTSGGAANSQYKYAWTRDMPIHQAQQVVNHFNQQGYVVVQIRDEAQYSLQNAESLHQVPPRQLMAMIKLANKRFFIDSFAQHAAAALKLKSTVVWVNTKPSIFGYSMHNNITPNVEMVDPYDKNQYLFDYDFNGPLAEYPYDTLDLFNVEEIIKSIEEN